tara:strand:- start:16848 stop:17726 length:879 start_codon:yes stop_codon:yes gene_type:complete
MTPTKTRKAVTPPTTTKVEAKAPVVEKKFTPRFTAGPKEVKPSVYELLKGSKRKNGMMQYPVVYMIKSEDIIFDPIKGENRKIRYIPGETSIYADEQSKNAKMREPIAFNKGFLYVDHTNPTLKKYLDHCNANVNNPHRMKNKTASFGLRDNERNAKQEIEKVATSMEAVQAALKMPLNELIGYAKVLGVNTNKSTDEIRWDMKVQAEKNPTTFLAGMNDPRTEMKQLLLMAEESGIISMKKTGVTWVSSGNTICVPAIGVKPIERMVDFCSEGEGEQIYSEIERRLKAING